MDDLSEMRLVKNTIYGKVASSHSPRKYRAKIVCVAGLV